MRRVTPIHPYRLSDSTLGLLRSCDRLFQIERLLDTIPIVNTPHAAPIRGTAFGVGVQTYMITGDMDKATIACWLAYWPVVEERYISCNRTLNNLWCAQDELDKLRRRYKVARFNGKDAAELSFRLDIDEHWFYVGYIDLVLYDTEDKIYVILEVKTTGYNLHDLKPVYKNSGQALGYSIVLDRITGEDQSKYGVLYFVCRDKGAEWVPDIYVFPFTKTLLDRYNWFISLGIDVERISRMLEIGVFPMRGSACVRYNKVCQHFGTCSITQADVSRKVVADETDYQFTYKLPEIIEDHLQRLQREVAEVN